MGEIVFLATSFRTVPTDQLAVSGRINIAECAGVGKVELDNIITVVE